MGIWKQGRAAVGRGGRVTRELAVGGLLCGAVLTVTLSLGAGARAAEDRVSLNFSGAEIEAVVRAIAEFTGKNFLVDPRVKGTMNLMIDRPVSREEALTALAAALRMQGYSIVESGSIVRVVPEADAKLQGGRVQTGRGAGPRGDELVTQVFRLNYESAASLVQVLRPLIAPNNTITAYPGNNTLVITDYAENLRRLARIIAAIDTQAGSEIDVVRLEHAIANDVAQMLTRMLDAGGQAGDAGQRVNVLAEPGSNALLIRAASPSRLALVRGLIAKFDQPSSATGNIHIVHLKNADATQLARTLLGAGGAGGGMLPVSSAPRPATQPGQAPQPGVGPGAASLATAAQSPVSGQVGGATIHADPSTNTLIITAPEAVYRQLRGVIDRLDVRRAQVFIESLIVEVSSAQAAEFGIQWMGGMKTVAEGGAGVVGGTNFGGVGQNILGAAKDLTTVGQGMNVGVVRGQITLPGVGVVTNLGALARALEQTNKANILSTPTVLTLDNEEARIVVGQNVPFITGQYASAATTPGATVNPFQTIERRDVGLTLKVRPQISEGGTIKLVIYQEVSSVVDATGAAGVITNKRSIETNVLVDNSSIVALGGLVQDQVTGGVDKVPLLGDLPLIGHLFRYETRKQQKTNLMVFLRPLIVSDDRASRTLAIDRYDQLRSAQEQNNPGWHPVLPSLEAPALPDAQTQPDKPAAGGGGDAAPAPKPGE